MFFQAEKSMICYSVILTRDLHYTSGTQKSKKRIATEQHHQISRSEMDEATPLGVAAHKSEMDEVAPKDI